MNLILANINCRVEVFSYINHCYLNLNIKIYFSILLSQAAYHLAINELTIKVPYFIKYNFLSIEYLAKVLKQCVFLLLVTHITLTTTKYKHKINYHNTIKILLLQKFKFKFRRCFLLKLFKSNFTFFNELLRFKSFSFMFNFLIDYKKALTVLCSFDLYIKKITLKIINNLDKLKFETKFI